MYTTSIDLPKAIRDQVVPLLQSHLADAVDLFTQVKQAHWNVKGPSFIALHELFDERITALGARADGTARVSVNRSRIQEYPFDIADGRDHVAAITARLATSAGPARSAIDSADQLGDADTADIFTEISREIDKQLWFVEAHLQASH